MKEKIIQAFIINGEEDFWSIDDQIKDSKRFNWDLCSKDFVDDDRLNETWKGVSADIEDFAHHSRIQPFDDKSKTSKKVILLMHERAFRQCGSKYKDEASKLSLLIKSLRKKGFTFDTIDNY